MNGAKSDMWKITVKGKNGNVTMVIDHVEEWSLIANTFRGFKSDKWIVQCDIKDVMSIVREDQ